MKTTIGKYMPMEKHDFGVKGFPKPCKKDLKVVDKKFKQYIFFTSTKEGKVITTTCCHKEQVLCKNISGKHNDKITCPYCGAEATFKNRKKLKRLELLNEYIPVIFLVLKKNKLYAIAAWAYRDYDWSLCGKTQYKVSYIYKFEIGKVTSWTSYYGRFTRREKSEKLNPKNDFFNEPLREYGSYGYPMTALYYVIGIDRIAKSELRYCQYEKYEEYGISTTDCLIRYLTAYCIYPDKVEMLVKMGLEDFVTDLIYERRKNADLLKWEEKDLKKAFKLPKSEIKTLKERGISIGRVYANFQKKNFPVSWELAEEIEINTCDLGKKILKNCTELQTTPQKLINYLKRFTGPRCYGGYYGLRQALGCWEDYIMMAKTLEYDLTVHNVAFPRQLEVAHDEAVTLMNRKKEEADAVAAKKRHEESIASIKRRAKKYNFALGDLFIRVAMNESEITAEGKALCHCVGGYAIRHMEDKTTILFMRRRDLPNTPFVTIEMRGNEIVQAHGYMNDRKSKMPPREEYKDFFDAWIKWLEGGSKRKENGSAKIDVKEVKGEAA